MNIKPSIKNYNIIQSSRYIIPENEMPLRFEVSEDDAVFFVTFEAEKDPAKEKNWVEDSVKSDELVYRFVNWDIGRRMNTKMPVPFVQLGSKEIHLFISVEKTSSNVFCFDVMFLDRK